MVEATPASEDRSAGSISPYLSSDGYFDSLFEAIRGARHRVLIEMYIIASDDTGWAFARALADAAGRGVGVRLVYDAAGCAGADPGLFEFLDQHGVSLLEFRGLRSLFMGRLTRRQAESRRWRARASGPGKSAKGGEAFSPWLNRRNHRKTIMIDGALAFCGGANVGDEYAVGALTGASAGAREAPWVDLVVRVEGAVVAELEEAFARTWERSGGHCGKWWGELMEGTEPDDPPGWLRALRWATGRSAPAGSSSESPAESTPAASSSLGRALLTGIGYERAAIAEAIEGAVESAQERIDIYAAYFLPSRALMRQLEAAVRRGVRVRVLLPGDGDVWFVAMAMGHYYDRLLRQGVRLFHWGGMMHAKAVAVDRSWFTVGSANLDPRSRYHNAEANIESEEPGVAGWLAETFERHVAAAEPLELKVWRERSMWRRVAEWICSRFRYWL